MKRPIECRVNPSVVSWGTGDDGEREFIIYAYATKDNPKDTQNRAIHVKLTPADAGAIVGLLESGMRGEV